MSNQQQSLYSDSNFWKKAKELFKKEIAIKVDINGKWYWECEGLGRTEFYWTNDRFPTAKDAEQDLITFLKNYEGFRNG